LIYQVYLPHSPSTA